MGKLYAVQLADSSHVDYIEVDAEMCVGSNCEVHLQSTTVLHEYIATVNGNNIPVQIRTDGMNTATISVLGYTYSARVLLAEHQELFSILKNSAGMRSRSVRVQAPMPGLLKSILIADGATVRKGDPLFMLEAMKMENSILAPLAGVVREVSAHEGQAVEKGVRLCTIEPEEASS